MAHKCCVCLHALVCAEKTVTSRGGQLAAQGPRVAHHSVFSAPRKHSERIVKI